LPAGATLESLAARRDLLADLADRVTARLGGPCPTYLSSPETPITSGRPEIQSLHLTDTSKLHAMNGLSIATNKAKAESAAPCGSGGDGCERRPDHGLSAVPLALAVAAAGPELRAALARQGEAPNWRALTDAAREITPLLGVGGDLWGEACGRLGRGGAALAIVIIERGLTRGPGEAAAPIRRPEAYLRGLLERADKGELHLDRSLRAFAQRGAG
jgi:hypothetical protein